MQPNFDRLLDTLAAIPPNRKASTSEILGRLRARGHDVTMRTLQRDLDALSKGYGITCDEKHKPYGWQWPAKAERISLPTMDWPEALSFYLLREHLSGLLPESVREHLVPYMRQAEEKLSEQFRDIPLKRWPDKVRIVQSGQPKRSPRVLRSVRDTVTEALLNERQLEIVYKRPSDNKQQQWTVHPLALIQREGVFYLAVRFWEYEDPRSLVLHRIERAIILDDAVVPPPGFSLDKWLSDGAMGFGGTGLIRFVADFHDGAGKHLLESPLSEDQEAKTFDTDGERIRVTATVTNTEQLRWWLLGFAGRVEVIEPQSLRKDIAARLKAAARRYPKEQA